MSEEESEYGRLPFLWLTEHPVSRGSVLSHGIGHRVENSVDLTLLQFAEEGLAYGCHADFDLAGAEVA